MCQIVPRILIILVVFAMSSQAAAQFQFHETFDEPLDPTIYNLSGSSGQGDDYSWWLEGGEIHFDFPQGDSGGWTGLSVRFHVVGDYTATIRYRLLAWPAPPEDPSAIHLGLNEGASPQRIWLTRRSDLIGGLARDRYEVREYYGGPSEYNVVHYSPASGFAGQFKIERESSTTRVFADDVLLWQGEWNTEPCTVGFFSGRWQTGSPLHVVYDDFEISADGVRFPDPVDEGLVGYWSFDEGSGSTAHDDSGNGNSGVILGASWGTGRLGYGLDFDGTDDYVNVGTSPIFALQDSFTLCAWVKTDSTQAGRMIYRAAGGIGGNINYQMWATGNTATVAFGTGVGGASVTASAALPGDGGWHHVAGTFSDSEDSLTVYVDGDPISSVGTIAVPYLEPGSALLIGSGDGTGSPGVQVDWPFDGSIDEVRIYDRALSQDEIELLYECPSGDSLIVKGTNVELWGNHQYCTVRILNGGSIVVPQAEWDSSTWIGGYLMLEADTIYIDSNSSIHADACGFSKEDGHSDGGPGHGEDFIHDDPLALISADGAGYGGRGGHYWTTIGTGGPPYGVADQDGAHVETLFGSAGGDYAWLDIGLVRRGGRGGGYIRLRGNAVTVQGTITANGGSGLPAGLQPPGAGSGGGSGGQIVFDSPDLTITGTVGARGGHGSDPSEIYSGGGGAGGRIKVLQPSSGVCGGAFSVAGGAGCNGMGVGGAGTIYTPSAIPSTVPTISGLVNDSGREPDDLHTSDTRIAGTAEVGSIVRLYIAGLSVGAGEADGVTGEFSVAANAAADGLNEVTATVQAPCKSESGLSGSFTFTLDRQAPDPPGAPDLIEDAFTGGQATDDDIVSTATPTFGGTTEPDAEVKLYEGEIELGGLITRDGVWTITSIPLAEGTHLATAKATDLAGNESGVSSPLPILIDLAPPEITGATVAPTGCVPVGRVFDLSMNLSDTLSGIGVSWPPQAIIHGGSLNHGIDLAPVGGTLYRGSWNSEGTGAGTYSVDFEGFDIAGNRELLEDSATICLARPGDHDFDGDTDLFNFARFQTCFTGNTGSATSRCEMMDMDGNGTVDVTDFATFRAFLGGPH